MENKGKLILTYKNTILSFHLENYYIYSLKIIRTPTVHESKGTRDEVQGTIPRTSENPRSEELSKQAMNSGPLG